MSREYFFKCGCKDNKFLTVSYCNHLSKRYCPKCYRQDKKTGSRHNQGCRLVKIEADCVRCGKGIVAEGRGLINVKLFMCRECLAQREMEKHRDYQKIMREAAQNGHEIVSRPNGQRTVKVKCPMCGELRMMFTNKTFTTKLPRVYCHNCSDISKKINCDSGLAVAV